MHRESAQVLAICLDARQWGARSNARWRRVDTDAAPGRRRTLVMEPEDAFVSEIDLALVFAGSIANVIGVRNLFYVSAAMLIGTAMLGAYTLRQANAPAPPSQQ